jgi:hypothetical protein
MSNGIDGIAFTFGKGNPPEGTTHILIDLARETTEYGRQLAMAPKAMHPQMESLVSRRGEEKPILSIAACGFGQLALMDDVPDEVADEFQIPRFGFRSSSVVNISSEILSECGIVETVILDEDSISKLQQFLVLYAQAVWRVENPLVIMIDPRAVQETVYDGVRWFTFPVAFIVSVEQEEWDKLYSLKADEILWAARMKELLEVRAKMMAINAITKSSHH